MRRECIFWPLNAAVKSRKNVDLVLKSVVSTSYDL
jgi:hypothetical protein